MVITPDTNHNTPKMEKRKNITVYCASSPAISRDFFDAAEELACLMAERKMSCIYGAGAQGLMGCIADTMLRYGGKVIGVIPRFMTERGWCHPALTETIVTETMHQRKTVMAEKGDASIALPGGCGTIEELFEIITWKQLGLYTHPIVVLNTNGYYNPLIEMLQNAIDNHFMRDIHSKLWYTANSPQEAIEAVLNLPEWDNKLTKF